MKWSLLLLVGLAWVAYGVRQRQTPESPPGGSVGLSRPAGAASEETRTPTEGFAGYRYLYLLPAHYQPIGRKYPLVVFLHGACPDDNLEKLKHFGPIKFMLEHPELPFIAVSPASARGWSVPDFKTLLTDVLGRFPVDEARIYLTGYSLGAQATWTLAAALPRRFAAIAPVAGVGNPAQVIGNLARVPVWVFHGAKDNVIPVGYSLQMVKVLQRTRGEVKCTIYPECGHESWQFAFNEPELYEWFLQHRLVR